MGKNKLTILGLGKLGLPFSLLLEKNGFSILGVDINRKYVDDINKKTIDTNEPKVKKYLQIAKDFKATTNVKRGIEYSDYLFILVATPSLKDGRYDHRQIDGIARDLIKYSSPGQKKNVIICCTTMPGYCDKLQNKLKPYGYSVSYNPEFIAQGSVIEDLANPDIVLIGESNNFVGDKIENIYLTIVKNEPSFHRMSTKEAEITKIALNCFLTTKIAYANMVGDIAISADCNPDLILRAIGSDSRIGEKYINYGYGFGGPCLPRDNKAFSKFAGDQNIKAVISQASDMANDQHLDFQLQQFKKINDKREKIIFKDVTYKIGTTIIEESQKLKLAILLAHSGYKIVIKDNPKTISQIKKIYGDLFEYI